MLIRWILLLFFVIEIAGGFPLKLAFVGDQGLGSHSKAVLKMISSSHALVLLGDYDYQDSPRAFMNQLKSSLSHIPIFAVVGNHDLLRWNDDRGYRDRLLQYNQPFGLDCQGEFGINQVCLWNGIVSLQKNALIIKGVSTLGNRNGGNRSLEFHITHVIQICTHSLEILCFP